jgi:hypothetical protein
MQRYSMCQRSGVPLMNYSLELLVAYSRSKHGLLLFRELLRCLLQRHMKRLAHVPGVTAETSASQSSIVVLTPYARASAPGGW